MAISLFNSSFSEFRNIPQVMTLQPSQQKSLYDQITDIGREIPYSAFMIMMKSVFVDMNDLQISDLYKQYVNDLNARRAAIIQDLRSKEEGTKYVNRNLSSDYRNLDWLNERPFSTIGGVDRAPIPPALLLEDGDYVLLEDMGYTLLEDDTL